MSLARYRAARQMHSANDHQAQPMGRRVGRRVGRRDRQAKEPSRLRIC